jgi:hypothetical protein
MMSESGDVDCPRKINFTASAFSVVMCEFAVELVMAFTVEAG